jgi:hypothetical protein
MKANMRRALAAQERRDDARAEFLAMRGKSAKAFAGGTPATINGQVTIPARNATPGLTFGVRSERGRTIRAGKKNSLRLVRPNPAQGEDSTEGPRYASHEVVASETGEIVEGVQSFPPTVEPCRRYTPSKDYGYEVGGAASSLELPPTTTKNRPIVDEVTGEKRWIRTRVTPPAWRKVNG